MWWRAGIPPPGETGGEEKDARDETANFVAAAALAFRDSLEPNKETAHMPCRRFICTPSSGRKEAAAELSPYTLPL